MTDIPRREIIGSLGSLLGIGYLGHSQDGTAPIIINGDPDDPALEIQDAYFLDGDENATSSLETYGEEIVSVEGLIENVGSEIGDRTVTLFFDEDEMGNQFVELEPADTEIIYFAPDAPSVDSETTIGVHLDETVVGELVVQPRVDIQVVGAWLLDDGQRVDEKTITEDELIEAEVDLQNYGIDSGDFEVELEKNGTVLDDTITTVAPADDVVSTALSGEAPEVDEETNYSINIADHEAGQVSVEPTSDTPDSGGTHQWDYIEGSGTTVEDSNGSLNLSYTGLSWDTGAGTEDVHAILDGVDDYADLGDDFLTSFINDAEGTIFTWHRVDDTGDNINTLFASYFTSSGTNFTLTARTDNNEWYYRLTIDGASEDISGGDLGNNIGEWVAVAVVADGSDIRLFVALPPDYDVVEVSTAPAPATSTQSTWDATVSKGRETVDDRRYFEGGIDLSWGDTSPRTQSDLQSFVDDSASFYE